MSNKHIAAAAARAHTHTHTHTRIYLYDRKHIEVDGSALLIQWQRIA
jgi:hypothetical protein